MDSTLISSSLSESDGGVFCVFRFFCLEVFNWKLQFINESSLALLPILGYAGNEEDVRDYIEHTEIPGHLLPTTLNNLKLFTKIDCKLTS